MVFCLPVVDQKIIAFELYCLLIGVIWGKTKNLDCFVSSSKSFVACLCGYRHVSYKCIRGSEMEDQISDRRDKIKVCRRASWSGGCSSPSEEEFEIDKRYYIACKI
jgi:hypothetical protein